MSMKLGFYTKWLTHEHEIGFLHKHDTTHSIQHTTAPTHTDPVPLLHTAHTLQSLNKIPTTRATHACMQLFIITKSQPPELPMQPAFHNYMVVHAYHVWRV